METITMIFLLGIVFTIDVLLLIGFTIFLFCARNTCVIKGTKILTKRGEKDVEKLTIGEKLYDDSELLKLKSFFIKEIYKINGELKVSQNHLLLTNEGWKKTKYLKEGDFIFKLNKFILVNKIERLRGKIKVYDLCVSNSHTFYADKYLTHNKSL